MTTFLATLAAFLVGETLFYALWMRRSWRADTLALMARSREDAHKEAEARADRRASCIHRFSVEVHRFDGSGHRCIECGLLAPLRGYAECEREHDRQPASHPPSDTRPPSQGTSDTKTEGP